MGKLVRGIGVNDADYDVFRRLGDGVIWKCPYYALWANVLTRCTYEEGRYSYDYLPEHNHNYSGVSVCDEWKYFSKFKEWVDNYGDPLWYTKHLDKDIIGDGTLYSPDTCCFVPSVINMSLHSKSNKINDTLQGVGYFQKKNRFYSVVTIEGKPYFKLKYFKTEMEAHKYYQQGKSEVLLLLANKYFELGEISIKVRDKLIYKANEILDDLKHDRITIM